MEKILCCIVLYGQRLSESRAYLSLVECGFSGGIYVYDNSPEGDNSAAVMVDSYISDTSNSGLSTAYNSAARYALSNGYNWLMLLDQDTQVSSDYLSSVVTAISQKTSTKLFVPRIKVQDGRYMSPTIHKHKRTTFAQSAPRGIISLSKYTAINSGMVIDVFTFFEVGGYNERLRLDFSDFEFLAHFSRTYIHIYVLDSELMQNFSYLEQNFAQSLGRFKIFCRCIRACRKYSLRDRLDYFTLVTKKMLSMSLRNKSLRPFFIYLRHYIF